MTNWFVRINHRKDNKDNYYSQQVERRLYYNLATKKDVLDKIKEDYPEYFSDKIPQRTAKGEFFFVNVYELDEHWEAFGLRRSPVNFAEKIQLIVST